MQINWSQMTDEWIRQRFGDEMSLDQIINCRNELVNTGLIKDMELFIEKKQSDPKCWLRRLPIFIKKDSNLNAQIRLHPKYHDKSMSAGATFSKGQPSLNVSWSKIFYNKYNPFSLDASIKAESLKGLPQLSAKASLPWFDKEKHRDTYHASVTTNCKDHLWTGKTVAFTSKLCIGSDRLGTIRMLDNSRVHVLPRCPEKKTALGTLSLIPMLAVSLERNLGAVAKLQAILQGRTLFGSRLFLDHKFHGEFVQPLQQEALYDTMDSLCNGIQYPYEYISNSPFKGLTNSVSEGSRSPVKWLTSDGSQERDGDCKIPSSEYVSFGGDRVLRNWKQVGREETKAVGMNLVFGCRNFPHRSLGLFTFFDGLATPNTVRAGAGIGIGAQLLPNVTIEAALGTNLTSPHPGDEIKVWDIRARMH